MKQRVSTPTPGRLTVLAALLAGLAAPALALAASGNIVVSQVYGGGGNSGATYKNDFIELRNISDSAVNLTGWSVQYASASGDSWQVTKLPDNFVLQPGQYLLVQEAVGAGGTTALPQPDASGTIPMSATGGKVALSSTATALSGVRPTANVVDFVGFGTATSFEGSGATPSVSNTLAALRKGGGCVDTDNNGADFTAAAPGPRNNALLAGTCSGTAVPQPIVLTCPGSVGAEVGSGATASLSARDADSIVNAAAISSAAVAGISLVNFTPAAANDGIASATLTVDASVPAGTYPVVVTFRNNANQSASCTVNVAISGSLRIPQIQGSGPTSPYANTVQITSGVITKKFATGFYIQDEQGDGDPSTSDAIFVYGATTTANVGDEVRVSGTVTEYTPNGATRSYTELKDVSAVTILSTGHTIAPTNIDLPNADLARYEGMLVRFTSPLTVNGNSYLGDRGELVLSNGRRETATNRYRAGSADATALIAANAQNFVILDDGIFTVPDHIPYLAADKTVRSGDTVTDLVGVLDFGAIGGGGGWYKLQPTETPVFSRTNPRMDVPSVVPGNVRVASANVLNFFTTFTDGTDVSGKTGQGCTIGTSTTKSNCRGADNITEFNRQRDKIVNELKAMNADAVGLMEIQNNGDVAVGYLVDALNKAIGSPTYTYVAKPAATGTDAIRVALIYKPAVLTPLGAALSDGDAINNRAPIGQTFKVNANGAKFSLIVNHLKSKGSCGGGAGDTDSGDGQGCWNATRLQQVQRLYNYFIPAVVQAAGGDTDVLAVGDFNSYGHEDPIAYLTDKGMVNELEKHVRGAGSMPYSYVFDGASGYLDHALASSTLDPQVAGVTEWHNNADEPDAIDYNLGDTADDPYVDNAFRASDHDPVVISLNLAAAYVDVTASVKVAVSAPVTNRITGKTTVSVSFTNTSGKAITGPLQAILQGLPAGVTLDNKNGDFSGSPYLTLPSSTLAAGATATVTGTFSNPSKVAVGFAAKLYTGAF